MPAKPAWYSKIDEVVAHLQTQSRPFVDRATIEFLLGVGRRRAQQILAPCITERVGANGLADRNQVIERLRQLAQGDNGYYERRRRRRVADVLDSLRRERMEKPQLLVEAPLRVIDQKFQDLPPGVHLEIGRITVEFDQPRQALEKLLALAMAIGNDFRRFEQMVAGDPPLSSSS
jgi:hypothetical protein